MSSVELAPPTRYRGAFRRLYLAEMRLVLRRRRNLILLGVLALVPVLIGVAVKVSDPGAGDGPQFLGRITGNGLFLVFTAITVSMPFFLPLVIGVIAGDSIAGEAGLGTLRYLLTVPVSRGRLLAMKTLAVASFTFIAVLVVALVGLLTGSILFGLHSLVLLSGDTVGLGSGLLRSLGVVVYVTIALFGLAAGGVFISTLTENAIAAMATTVSIAVFSALLDAVPQLSAIHPGLLTDHWLSFGELLRSSISWVDLARWTLLHLAYAAVFLSLAWSRMTTKDVTS
ncbi:MAG TPA: ABC transporter permease [Jatrophihabitans sp.]|jgi:ABC-2 type transport system permease protein|uniref:ABC transporter permease n=1 Tax=Jatrophihabitans sp. TaxID=1932789 RepID=UPI002E01CDA6|nr:ABC transporter permease [Jatrophihabitans sp.]